MPDKLTAIEIKRLRLERREDGKANYTTLFRKNAQSLWEELTTFDRLDALDLLYFVMLGKERSDDSVNGWELLDAIKMLTGNMLSTEAPSPLDTKFYGVLKRTRDNKVEPADGYMIFVARDNAILPTLKFYQDECARLNADPYQQAAIERLIARVQAWRDANPDKCKTPDIAPDEIV